jgi:putative acetyltransferase
MDTGDALAFLQVHRAAVRVTAAKDYPTEVIDAWAPIPLTPQNVERVSTNPDGEIRIIAEQDGTVVGISAIVLANSELRACYVRPDASRMGVGSALVDELESIACRQGLSELFLDSSLTAEPFYLRRGYRVIGPGEHIFRSGFSMACVKMHKFLAR